MSKAAPHAGSKNVSQPDDGHQQYQKDWYTAHALNRNNLDDRAFKTSERYDQWVLTLAGGALAISLTFLEKIAPEPAHNTLVLLGLSWAIYIFAVLAGFCAIYYSRKAIQRAIEIADASYNHFIATSTKEKPQGEPPPSFKNHPSKIVSCLNKISLGCLVCGTGLLCAFALVNLGNAKVSKPPEPAKEITVIANFPQSTNTISITNTTKVNP
jgi:TRAP-type C4-dicarboxylate transport system permease small subunit